MKEVDDEVSHRQWPPRPRINGDPWVEAPDSIPKSKHILQLAVGAILGFIACPILTIVLWAAVVRIEKGALHVNFSYPATFMSILVQVAMLAIVYRRYKGAAIAYAIAASIMLMLIFCILWYEAGIYNVIYQYSGPPQY